VSVVLAPERPASPLPGAPSTTGPVGAGTAGMAARARTRVGAIVRAHPVATAGTVLVAAAALAPAAALRSGVGLDDAANVLALDSGATGTFNVASGEPHTVGELAQELTTAFGGPAPETTGDYRLGDVRHVFASTERAAELGFRAKISFAEGVRELATAPLR